MAALEAKTEGAEESAAEIRGIVERLDKLKLSGYVQGRFEWHDDSQSGLNSSNKAATTTQFLVRRARLKATYKGTYAELVLQAEFAGATPSLKDAEATLIEPWTGFDVNLTVGQFKWPFGYDVLLSSVSREMPERARMSRVLFPNERDRGVRVKMQHEALGIALALVNGNGTTDPTFGINDQNHPKDFVGRVSLDLEWIVFGVSGYTGRWLVATPGDSKATPPTEPTKKSYAKTRLGADAQLYGELLPIGGTALKLEGLTGKELGKSVLGAYATLVQHLGSDFGVFARGDYYDKDTDASDNGYAAIGGGVQWFASGNLRATAAYEHPINEGKDVNDDSLTLQLQAMY